MASSSGSSKVPLTIFTRLGDALFRDFRDQMEHSRPMTTVTIPANYSVFEDQIGQASYGDSTSLTQFPEDQQTNLLPIETLLCSNDREDFRNAYANNVQSSPWSRCKITRSPPAWAVRAGACPPPGQSAALQDEHDDMEDLITHR